MSCKVKWWYARNGLARATFTKLSMSQKGHNSDVVMEIVLHGHLLMSNKCVKLQTKASVVCKEDLACTTLTKFSMSQKGHKSVKIWCEIMELVLQVIWWCPIHVRSFKVIAFVVYAKRRCMQNFNQRDIIQSKSEVELWDFMTGFACKTLTKATMPMRTKYNRPSYSLKSRAKKSALPFHQLWLCDLMSMNLFRYILYLTIIANMNMIHINKLPIM